MERKKSSGDLRGGRPKKDPRITELDNEIAALEDRRDGLRSRWREEDWEWFNTLPAVEDGALQPRRLLRWTRASVWVSDHPCDRGRRYSREWGARHGSIRSGGSGHLDTALIEAAIAKAEGGER